MLTTVSTPVSSHCCIPYRASALPARHLMLSTLWGLYYFKIWNVIIGNTAIFSCSRNFVFECSLCARLAVQRGINHTNILPSQNLFSTLFRNIYFIVFMFIKNYNMSQQWPMEGGGRETGSPWELACCSHTHSQCPEQNSAKAASNPEVEFWECACLL